MVELKLGLRTVDLPYTVRIKGVTEEMFDELVDPDTKAELLDGVMIVHSPASLRHDNVSGFLRPLMRCFAEEKEFGTVLGPDGIVHLATCRLFCPDMFLVEQRFLKLLRRKQFDSVPKFIGEVLSPSNRDDDLEDKRPAYREAQVDEIWFVDPDEQQIIVDRRRKRGYATSIITTERLTSTALPGFWIDPAWLWVDPLPKVMTCLRQILA